MVSSLSLWKSPNGLSDSVDPEGSLPYQSNFQTTL